MARTPRDVTDVELEVLRALWELEQATIRSLADRVYPHGGASEYATVQSRAPGGQGARVAPLGGARQL